MTLAQRVGQLERGIAHAEGFEDSGPGEHRQSLATHPLDGESQHRLLEKSRDVYGWLENGAHFYVCGDKARLGAAQQKLVRLPDGSEFLVDGKPLPEDYVQNPAISQIAERTTDDQPAGHHA